jgi:hypothetical protein
MITVSPKRIRAMMGLKDATTMAVKNPRDMD